jgi:hypothetical protein
MTGTVRSMSRIRFGVLGRVVEFPGTMRGVRFDVLGFGVELVATREVRFDVLGFAVESVATMIGVCSNVLGFGIEMVDDDSVNFTCSEVQGGDTDRARFSRLIDVGSNSLC